MTLKERIRYGFLGQQTDKIPLHCRLRMAPLVPEFQWVRDLGWGVIDVPSGFEVEYDGCTIKEEIFVEDDRQFLRRSYETPAGKLSALLTKEPQGGGQYLYVEHPFKEMKDLPALFALVESMRYSPAYDEFKRIEAELSDQGYCVSWVGYDPMHEIMVNLMGVETFSYTYMDQRDYVLSLYDVLTGFSPLSQLRI